MTLRRRSKKLARVYIERRKLVAARLADQPWCSVQWDERCEGRATTLHELRKRSQGGSILAPGNCIPSCGFCNGIIEDYPAEAHRRGFVLRAGDVA